MARVLIGYSTCDLTRAAFMAQGHEVWTCDLRNVTNSHHLQCDIWEALSQRWDFAVLHPMCTYLTTSGAWAFADPDFDRYPGVGYHQRVTPGTLVGAARRAARDAALENFERLLGLPFPVAIENPGRSFVCNAIRRPDQCIQPWQFGDDASKLTGLWLTRGVPPLTATMHVLPRYVDGRPRWANQTDSGQNRLSPGVGRWLERSRTYAGIAQAMGDQWGRWLKNPDDFNLGK